MLFASEKILQISNRARGCRDDTLYLTYGFASDVGGAPPATG